MFCTAAESTPVRLTLVTALFDLARREPGSSRPTPADYLDWGAFVFALDCDIVFYVDPELEPEVRARRDAHGLLARTVVIAAAFEHLPAHDLLEPITAARRQHPLRNAQTGKDTPLYTALGWSKFELVRRTLAADPFTATHFAWIDLGLAKVADTEHAVEDGVFSRPGERAHLLMLREPMAVELADREHYLSQLWGHMAAGYISADRTSFSRLCTLVIDAAHAALEQGFAASDEQLLALVHDAQNDLFVCHHGDYRQILANYHRVRGSAGNLLDQLRQSRGRGQWHRSRARGIAGGVVEALRTGTLADGAHVHPELLEECFIAIYFADYPRAAAAGEVVELYFRLTRDHPEFRDSFLRNEIRVRRNFSMLSAAAGYSGRS
jgi:hypothetical protein